MKKATIYNVIPDRIKVYIKGWTLTNPREYKTMFGVKPVESLAANQLIALLKVIHERDVINILKKEESRKK